MLQNGVCKSEHVVVGANTPVLNTLIMELTRNSPDMDEPEVCNHVNREVPCDLFLVTGSYLEGLTV